MSSSRRTESGEIRWWMPIVALLGATAALVFAAWIGGVDMAAAGERILDRLDETFHHSSWSIHDERGHLEVEFDRRDRIRRTMHDGRRLPPDQVLLEDGYITVLDLTYDDGELMYWRLPLHWEDELRESCRNPRWRLLLRVHPLPDGEPAGLRCARVAEVGLAGKAGLRVGDVLRAVNDQRTVTSDGLQDLLQRTLAELALGGTLTFVVEREGAELEVALTLPPLLPQDEWDAVPDSVTDPVDRYVLSQQPWRIRHVQADVEVHEDAVEAPLAPAAPGPAPPPAPDGGG
jgi:hypothetical protein